MAFNKPSSGFALPADGNDSDQQPIESERIQNDHNNDEDEEEYEDDAIDYEEEELEDEQQHDYKDSTIDHKVNQEQEQNSNPATARESDKNQSIEFQQSLNPKKRSHQPSNQINPVSISTDNGQQRNAKTINNTAHTTGYNFLAHQRQEGRISNEVPTSKSQVYGIENKNSQSPRLLPNTVKSDPNGGMGELKGAKRSAYTAQVQPIVYNNQKYRATKSNKVVQNGKAMKHSNIVEKKQNEMMSAGYQFANKKNTTDQDSKFTIDQSQSSSVPSGYFINNRVIRITEQGLRSANMYRPGSTANNPLYRPFAPLGEGVSYDQQQIPQLGSYQQPQQVFNQETIQAVINQVPPQNQMLKDAAEAAKSMRRVRLYSRMMVHDYENKFYRKKIRPSELHKHAEEIYDENLQLKTKLNQLEQHILMQKTQNKLLNNELEKQHDIVKRLFMNGINGTNNAVSSSHHNSSISSTIDGLRNNDQILILNLKRELDAALKQLSIKENEISTLKRCQKVTKHKELEEERKAYQLECLRLSKIVRDINIQDKLLRLSKKGLTRNDNSIQNPQYGSLDQQQYSTLMNQQLGSSRQQPGHSLGPTPNYMQPPSNNTMQTLIAPSIGSGTQNSISNQNVDKKNEDQMNQSAVIQDLQSRLQEMADEVERLEQENYNLNLYITENQNDKQQTFDETEAQKRVKIEDEYNIVDINAKDIKLQGKPQQPQVDDEKFLKLQRDHHTLKGEFNRVQEELKALLVKHNQEQVVSQQQLKEVEGKHQAQLEELQKELTAVTNQLEMEVMKSQTNNESPQQKQSQMAMKQSLDKLKEEINKPPVKPENIENDNIFDDEYQDDFNATGAKVNEQQTGKFQFEQDDEGFLNDEAIEDNYFSQQTKELKLKEEMAKAKPEKTDDVDTMQKEIEKLQAKLKVLNEQNELYQKDSSEVEKELKEKIEMLEQDVEEKAALNDMLAENIMDLEKSVQLERQVQADQILEELKRRLQIIRFQKDTTNSLNFFENCENEAQVKKTFEEKLHMAVSKHQIEILSKLENGKSAKELIASMCAQVQKPKFDYSAQGQKIVDQIKETLVSLGITNVSQLLEHFGVYSQRTPRQQHNQQRLFPYILFLQKTVETLGLPKDQALLATDFLLSLCHSFTYIDLELIIPSQESRRGAASEELPKTTSQIKHGATPEHTKKNLFKDDNYSEDEDQVLSANAMAVDDYNDMHLNNNNADLVINLDANEQAMIRSAASRRSFISQSMATSNQATVKQAKAMQYLKNMQLQMIAFMLVQSKLNLRQILKVYITSHQELGNSIEVIKLFHFMKLLKVKKVFTQITANDSAQEEIDHDEMVTTMLEQIDCVFEDHATGISVIHLQKLVDGLKAFGYQDLHLPKPKKNFDFSCLDPKSIRIMNRLASIVIANLELPLQKLREQYQDMPHEEQRQQFQNLIIEVLESSPLFKSVLKRALIKVGNNKEEKLILIQTPDFFKRLKEIGLRQSNQVHENLTQLLCLDPKKYPHFILLKKLQKAVEVFFGNPYLRSVGEKKNKLQSGGGNEDEDLNTIVNNIIKSTVAKTIKEDQDESEYYSEVDESQRKSNLQNPIKNTSAEEPSEDIRQKQKMEEEKQPIEEEEESYYEESFA